MIAFAAPSRRTIAPARPYRRPLRSRARGGPPSTATEGRCRRAAALACAAGLLGVALAGLGGCERVDHEIDYGTSPESIVAVPHPELERDLPEIVETGVIRMITRYNSSSYFIHKGGQAGFDFELFSRYARSLGLAVEVVIPGPGEDLISLLNSGRGDVICAGLTRSEQTDLWAAATRPYNFVDKVVVTPKDAPERDTIASLAGLTITITDHSPVRAELQELKERSGLSMFINTARPLVEEEELLAMVDRGEIEATVADDVNVRAAMTYLPGIRCGVRLSERRPVVWMVRQNCPELRASLNDYLKNNLWVTAAGETRRSQVYGIIYDRYYEDAQAIKNFQQVDDRPDKSGRISPYDELIQRQATAAGLDWRMVAALIYQESRFYPKALSKAGARGLMQVMPQFAGAQVDSLFLPAPNLRSGLRLLKQIYGSYAYLDSLERWRFTLATYHAGAGHVADARRLAMELGRDPNRWHGSVDEMVKRLMQRRWYGRTRHGFLRGEKTVAYVEEIIGRCQTYMLLTLTAELPPEKTTGEPDRGPPRLADRAETTVEIEPPPESP
jgi:membrane-bound lytic murein transglycosylase F